VLHYLEHDYLGSTDLVDVQITVNCEVNLMSVAPRYIDRLLTAAVKSNISLPQNKNKIDDTQRLPILVSNQSS
jgi:hypothetical protein